MKETGIIMSGSHPVDILEGRKTQTRRVIKPNLEAKLCKNSDIVRYCNTKHRDAYMFEVWHPANENTPLPLMIRCPYGQVGDTLWVRETWAVDFTFDKTPPIDIAKNEFIFYKYPPDVYSKSIRGKWRPSIYMPRWASRILLEIVGIRVERLQEITYDDCYAEGISKNLPNIQKINDMVSQQVTPKTYFSELWDSLNAKRGYGWETNSWVWVIGFERKTRR